MKIKNLLKKVKEKAWAVILTLYALFMSSYTVYADDNVQNSKLVKGTEKLINDELQHDTGGDIARSDCGRFVVNKEPITFDADRRSQNLPLPGRRRSPAARQRQPIPVAGDEPR